MIPLKVEGKRHFNIYGSHCGLLPSFSIFIYSAPIGIIVLLLFSVISFYILKKPKSKTVVAILGSGGHTAELLN
jgi:hypothetical protein